MKTKIRWDGETDGPYILVDNVIDYLTTIHDELEKQGGDKVLLAMFDRMIRGWGELKAGATRDQLLAVVNKVDPLSLADDLLVLRAELAGRTDDG